ncbi:hypothetical protein COJ88_29495 [Bacillus cereus]|nr:hypothetical protein COJ88_29495 [Bacillus cereus]PGL48984.1 hypothetical protein CN922_19485 [Bacillus cereus]
MLNVVFSEMLAIPYAYQSKVLNYPQNENFVSCIATKFIFIFLGAPRSISLMGMGLYPFKD